MQITKVLTGFSTAHRAWWSDSHCRFVHGYDRKFVITLECTELDHGWVYDFGQFKEIKKGLEEQFDHTLCIAHDDPFLEVFEAMDKMGLVQLRVMDNPGMEGAAKWVASYIDEQLAEQTNGRVYVVRVEAWENEKNSAVWVKQ